MKKQGVDGWNFRLASSLQEHVEGGSTDDKHRGDRSTDGCGASVDTETGQVGGSVAGSCKHRVGKVSGGNLVARGVVGVVPGQPDGRARGGEGRGVHHHDLDVEGATGLGQTGEHGGIATAVDGLDHGLRAAVAPDGITSAVLAGRCTGLESLDDTDAGRGAGDCGLWVVGEDLSVLVETESKVVVVQVPVAGVRAVVGVKGSRETGTDGGKVVAVEGDGSTFIHGAMGGSSNRREGEDGGGELHHLRRGRGRNGRSLVDYVRWYRSEGE